MIVFQIHVRGIPFGPPECDPPIAADVDRASAFVATGERVKADFVALLRAVIPRMDEDLP